MPVGEQAAGRSLGTIFYPARLTARFARGQLRHLFPRFLPGRGLSGQQGCPPIWDFKTCLGTSLVAPGEPSLLGSEGGKIAPAGRAAEGTGAEAQQESGPSRRTIVLGYPTSQFLPVAAGTTRVFPGSVRPDTGFPAALAAPAAKRRNADQTLQVFAQAPGLRHAHFSRPTAWTG